MGSPIGKAEYIERRFALNERLQTLDRQALIQLVNLMIDKADGFEEEGEQ